MNSPVLPRNAKKLMQVLEATLVLLLFCPPLFSQTSQGAIAGGVFDQSGGVIAGATVTVIDVARGVNRVLTSDSAGQYVANDLNPGMYTVRAEAKGFRTEEHSGVLVEVGKNVRVDLVVQPGEQTQTITVTGEIPAIDTSDATLGGTISNQAVNDLPLNGRNFLRLIQLRPGVVTSPGAAPRSSSTNGRRGGQDIVVLEGIPQSAQTTGGSTVLGGFNRTGDGGSLLPIDSIQEFNTQEDPKAEFGWKDGAVINVGVKSGTNSLHGTAYAFGRDAAATDAANWATGSVTPATLEQFGASAGGRILKDKLFWFANYEGLRTYLGDTTVLSAPTSISGVGGSIGFNPQISMVDACNSIKAANLANPLNNLPVTPLSALLAGLVHWQSSDPASCAVQPNSGFGTSMENVFPYLPSANSNQFIPGDHGVQTIGPLNNGLFKGDYVLGQHHHFSGAFFRAASTQFSNSSAGEASPQAEIDAVNKAVFYDGAWTWTPSSSWVNDFRVGYVTLYLLQVPADGNLLASGTWPNGYGMYTGVLPLNQTGAPGITSGGIPNIQFASFGGGTSNFMLGNGNRQDLIGPEGDLALVESVSYLRGKHAFKFGFDYMDIVFDGSTTDQAQGEVTFTDLPSFLQGAPSSGAVLLGNPTLTIRAHWYAPFVQDDWRVASRLTLNLGLRYEYDASPTERNNYIGGFNPSVNPLTASPIQQAGPGEPIPLYKPDPKVFMPRLGAAWDIKGNGKTVLRAGASVFSFAPTMGELISFYPFGANIPSIGINTSGQAVNLHTTSVANVPVPQLTSGWQNNTPTNTIFTPQTVTLGGPFPGTYTGLTCSYPGAPGLPAGYTPLPCSTATIDPNFRVPGAIEWNLDLERAITNNLTVDVAYVGSRGFNELYGSDINQPPLGSGWNNPTSALPAGLAANALPGGVSPAAYCMASAATGYNHCAKSGAVQSAMAANEEAASPYFTKFPYLGNIIDLGNGMLSRYNALQVTVEQRTSHGLAFIAGYAYAHALDEFSGNDPSSYDLIPNEISYRSLYANSANDVRHRFTFTPSYQIPGRKSPAEMLQGWSISGIFVAQQGLPWTANNPTSGDLVGTGESAATPNLGGAFQFWNYTGPYSAFTSGPPTIVSGNLVQGIPKFTKAAAVATCGTAATAPYGGPTTTLGQLALAALSDNGCYAQNGGILTPPAYGTLGNARREIFRSPAYYNVDMSVAKLWTFKERYSAQFRMEFFNLFNRADFTTPTSNPSGSRFGCSCVTPDSGNPVVGSGGPRHIQFGLRLGF